VDEQRFSTAWGGPTGRYDRRPMDAAPTGTLSLRLAGVILVGLWVVLGIAVGIAYRPGGQLDLLVAAVAFLPAVVAAAAVAWPAIVRSHRDAIGLACIWLAALLLTIPLLYAVAISLVSAGPQRLVPSPEAAYGSYLALASTALYSLLGLVHARASSPVFERAASVRSFALAGGVTIVVAFVFGGTLVLNERTLTAEATPASAFGPTDPQVVPPACDRPPMLGRYGRVAMSGRLLADDQIVAEAGLQGQRAGRDEVWGGRWSGVPVSAVAPGTGVAEGRIAYRRVGSQAWLNESTDDPDAPGTTWRLTDPDPFGLADAGLLTMDGPPRAVVTGEPGTVVAEDLGFEIIGGARARHCRSFVDGPTALSAFLPLRWLVGGMSTGLPTDLPAWRGELDWWVFGDGQLGRAAIEVSGLRSDAWVGPAAIEGALIAELDVTERARPVDVSGPVDARAGPSTRSTAGPLAGAPAASGSPPGDALESAAP
jgi:hypothetical protein